MSFRHFNLKIWNKVDIVWFEWWKKKKRVCWLFWIQDGGSNLADVKVLRNFLFLTEAWNSILEGLREHIVWIWSDFFNFSKSKMADSIWRMTINQTFSYWLLWFEISYSEIFDNSKFKMVDPIWLMTKIIFLFITLLRNLFCKFISLRGLSLTD